MRKGLKLTFCGPVQKLQAIEVLNRMRWPYEAETGKSIVLLTECPTAVKNYIVSKLIAINVYPEFHPITI